MAHGINSKFTQKGQCAKNVLTLKASEMWMSLFKSDLEKCSIPSLVHQWMWMGAVRMRVQTADINITIIHTTPVHQLTSCISLLVIFCIIVYVTHTNLESWEDKSWNKSIIKTFLTIIHYNASSSEKLFWSELGEKSAQIKHLIMDSYFSCVFSRY